MEKAEYQISTFCNFAECLGVSQPYLDPVSKQEVVDIVNTNSPDMALRTVDRAWLATCIIALQEDMISPEEFIIRAGASDMRSTGFRHLFTDEELQAFYEGAYRGEFDEVAGVEALAARIPNDVRLEDFLGMTRYANSDDGLGEMIRTPRASQLAALPMREIELVMGSST